MISIQSIAWVTGALVAVAVILIVWLVVVQVKLIKVTKRFNKMTGGAKVENMEELLADIQSNMHQLQADAQRTGLLVGEIQMRLEQMKSYVGIHRYNAFNDSGNDLSFSIAMINDRRDGVVITGLHNREDTYVYAKELERGESRHTLSPEEKEAISRAVPKA